jgi:hypothetical protein
MELSEDLQKRSEFIDWHEKVLHAHFLIYGSFTTISAMESSRLSEDLEVTEPLTISKLSELIAEDQSKQFCEF